MKNLLKKRQLILATLVLALGAAIFVNWYYSKPDIAANGKPLPSTATQQPLDTSNDEHLGDSQYVHNPYSSAAGEYFAGAKLKRSAAHDEAKDTLNAVITDTRANVQAVAEASKSLQSLASAIKLESDCEALITAKTGNECLVTINEEAVQAVMSSAAIDSITAMQIKEILLQKTGLSSDKISIVELK